MTISEHELEILEFNLEKLIKSLEIDTVSTEEFEAWIKVVTDKMFEFKHAQAALISAGKLQDLAKKLEEKQSKG